MLYFDIFLQKVGIFQGSKETLAQGEGLALVIRKETL